MKRTKKEKAPEEKVKQLDLGIKEPFKNKILKVKSKTDVMLLQLEVKKFLKDAFFWFVIVFDFVMTLQQGWIIYTMYNRLPSLVPIFNYYLVSLDSLANKNFIFIFPGISIISLLTGIIITTKYYNREKMLTKFILLCSLLTCIAETIILIHLTGKY